MITNRRNKDFVFLNRLVWIRKMKCNTVFICSICYHLFILFLAFRNIGKNIYIYSRLQNQPCFFCFIFSHLLGRALIWLCHFRPFWIISSEFVKVCWIRFSSWESFISFYIWCYPISSILACFIIREKVVLETEVAQARNLSIGEHRYCCVTFEI